MDRAAVKDCVKVAVRLTVMVVPEDALKDVADGLVEPIVVRVMDAPAVIVVQDVQEDVKIAVQDAVGAPDVLLDVKDAVGAPDARVVVNPRA